MTKMKEMTNVTIRKGRITWWKIERADSSTRKPTRVVIRFSPDALICYNTTKMFTKQAWDCFNANTSM